MAHEPSAIASPGRSPRHIEPGRFEPGRAGVTSGYLLPLARELQFNFALGDDGTASAAALERHRAVKLLAIWEETIEAQEQAAYWSREDARTKRAADATRLAPKLRGAVGKLGALRALRGLANAPKAPVGAASCRSTSADARPSRPAASVLAESSEDVSSIFSLALEREAL